MFLNVIWLLISDDLKSVNSPDLKIPLLGIYCNEIVLSGQQSMVDDRVRRRKTQQTKVVSHKHHTICKTFVGEFEME